MGGDLYKSLTQSMCKSNNPERIIWKHTGYQQGALLLSHQTTLKTMQTVHMQ